MDRKDNVKTADEQAELNEILDEVRRLTLEDVDVAPDREMIEDMLRDLHRIAERSDEGNLIDAAMALVPEVRRLLSRAKSSRPSERKDAHKLYA